MLSLQDNIKIPHRSGIILPILQVEDSSCLYERLSLERALEGSFALVISDQLCDGGLTRQNAGHQRMTNQHLVMSDPRTKLVN